MRSDFRRGVTDKTVTSMGTRRPEWQHKGGEGSMESPNGRRRKNDGT